MQEAPTRMRTEFARLIGDGWTLVRGGGAKLLALVVFSQLVIVGIAQPVIGWLFRQALRAGGMHGLDIGNLQFTSGVTVTLALLVLIITLAFVLISMQFTALVVVLRWVGPGLTLRRVLGEIARVFRKLFHVSSIPFVLYLFLLLPLTGFGFTSALVQGIAIPQFISGELYKSPVTAAVFLLFLAFLALLNIRLAAAVPVFVLSDASGSRALRGSWRITRKFRVAFPMTAAILVVVILASVAGALLIITAFLPTAATDEFFPGASIYVAAYSLGVAQVLGLLLSGLVTALIASVLVAVVMRHGDLLLPQVRLTGTEHVRVAETQSAEIARDRPGPLFARLVVSHSRRDGTRD
ncbi:MAG: glycerophosphoryl diester phosphodiesterase membrane domain-containing protein, partial [Leucobacter sp.]